MQFLKKMFEAIKFDPRRAWAMFLNRLHIREPDDIIFPPASKGSAANKQSQDFVKKDSSDLKFEPEDNKYSSRSIERMFISHHTTFQKEYAKPQADSTIPEIVIDKEPEFLHKNDGKDNKKSTPKTELGCGILKRFSFLCWCRNDNELTEPLLKKGHGPARARMEFK